MTNSKTKILVESAVMIALASVLSVLKIIDMPYGGSVTLASMLPLVIISYRHGLLWGFGSAFVYGVVQQLLGLDNLSYVTGWQSVIALIFLDYIFAFVVLGFGGVFRNVVKKQSVGLALGAGLAVFLRFVCHFLSGATVWAGLAIPDSAAIIYSLSYNATYMLPEAVILIAVAFYLGECLDFKSADIKRLVRAEGSEKVATLYAVSWFSLLAGFIADVVFIAPNLQNEESGEFSFANIGNTDWVAVAIISVITIALCVGLVLAAKRIESKPSEQ